jgi:nicotinamidase-related amidase
VGATTALLVIDLQNDYFNDDVLARCRDDMVETCNRLVRAAREAGAPVIEVQTVHAQDKSTWALNMLDDDQGMVLDGSDGAERLAGLLDPDMSIVKTRDSAFHRTGLETWLRDHGVHRLVLAGVSTESCIAATATDAYARDLRVVLVEDATASVERELHDQTLERLQMQYRPDVRSAADVRFS